jgi:hypothetical protein
MTHRHPSQPLAPEADLHLFIDMSGSNYPQNWQPIVFAEVERLQALSELLNKSHILRMTGFSHKLAADSIPVVVTSSYPAHEELLQLISEIPKAYGGTDFSLVFDYINADIARSDRDNVIVSDLEWRAASDTLRIEHPENLRYIAVPGVVPLMRSLFAERLDEAGLEPVDRITG